MSRLLPPLDMHAHISPGVSSRELEGLGAVVWAATRSYAEFEELGKRQDQVTIWGLGCHPALSMAQNHLQPGQFSSLMKRTPLVSEIGLDRRSRVPMKLQLENFETILSLLVRLPRVVSVHSFAATSEVLDCLERAGTPGIVLHWWLGTLDETKRALALGCFFSVNEEMLSRPDVLKAIPMNRLFTETDHPDGDRNALNPRQPGAVQGIEVAIAQLHRTNPAAVRQAVWSNLADLVQAVGVSALLPVPIRRMIDSVRQDP